MDGVWGCLDGPRVILDAASGLGVTCFRLKSSHLKMQIWQNMLKTKSLRKQTCFKIQFHVETHLTWKVFVSVFCIRFYPSGIFRRFGLKSGHLEMQIPQGKSAQIKKLKKTNHL